MSSGANRLRWRRALIVAGALSCVVLTLGFASVHFSAKRSPTFCTSCHTASSMPHVAAVGHEGVACQGCHSVETGEAFRLVGARLFGGKGPKGHGRALSTACTSCHNERDPKWSRIATTSGHQSHPTGVGAVDCLSCHRATSHAQRSAAVVCSDCHASVQLHAKQDGVAEGTEPQCLSCHNFALPKPDQASVTTLQCGRCHGEAAHRGEPLPKIAQANTVRAKDLHGGVDCKLCHQPHAGHGGIRAAKTCTNCHSILITDTGKLPAEHLLCEKCHEQHAPLAKAGSRCAGCHTQAVRSGTSSSTALQHDECASCHRPHTWVAETNGCVNCHVEEASLVASKSPEKHQRCVNCHEVHGPPLSGTTACSGCHKANAQKMLAAPAKHRDCTSCHNPHAPRTEAPRACAECHKAPVHQVVTMGPAAHAKASCTACHTLHGNPRADARACQGCHKDKRALVAKAEPAPHKDCGSCHRSHRFSITNVSQPCRRCHEETVTASTAHSGSCDKCHQVHGSPRVAQDKCLGCHTKLPFKPPAGNVPHGRCASCHAPHKRAQGALTRCAGCHEDKSRIAKLWPAHSAHREACNNCHEPHGVQNVKSCGDCHKTQAASAQGGRHRCVQCHSPHAAPPSSKQGWWGKCVGCHATQVEASKKHTACNACHKPHAFSPPACTSCHKSMTSKAAHAVKAHQTCTDCHDAHAATFPGRAECLKCHKDRANHQPNARQCQGCHLFK